MKLLTIAGYTVGVFVVGNTIQATVHDGQDIEEDSFRTSVSGIKVINQLKKEFWGSTGVPDTEEAATAIHVIDYKPIKVFGKESLVLILK